MNLSSARVLSRATHELRGLVDLQRYALPNGKWFNPSQKLPAFVQEARQRLRRDGVVTFPNFLTDAALSSATQEVLSKVSCSFVTNNTHNAYLAPTDPLLAKTHIRNLEGHSLVGATAYDQLDPNGAVRRVYESDSLLSLVAAVLGKEGPFFRLADPLGACTVNIFQEGMNHFWHFDESEYSVTLCLQDAREGGHFEYTVPLRKNREDKAFGEVENFVLERRPAKVLDLKPGTLTLFAGRYSLHRVTEVKGDRARLVAVLCFATTPDQRNSPEVQKLFWGRSK